MRIVPWCIAAASLCLWMLLTHGTAAAVCTVTETSAAVTDALALGTNFDPLSLAAGSQITGTVSGTCKSLTGAGTVTIMFGNGSNYTGTNRAMKCAACAGPSPFNLLQYQIYETNGTTVFPVAGLAVSCAGNCKSAAGSTYTYNFIGQIIVPSAATSLNDSQIGSYTDSLVATATGTGVAAVNTTISTTGSVAQFCTVSTTTNIGFGSYDPVTVSAVTNGTGVIAITCTRGNAGVTLTLSAGNNSTHATTPQTRAMVGATHGNYISYDIFETNAYATRYPTTAVAESSTVTGGITTPTALSLFGQIPAAAQDVSVDTYSDTVTATINF